MKCESFREACVAGSELTSEALAHLRTCEACLNQAINVDPELMFRALDGAVDPPGGVDAFVADVMHDIRFRNAERVVDARHRFAPAQRWAIAAAALVAVISGSIFWPRQEVVAPAPLVAVTSSAAVVMPVVSRPVVESYGSPGAMIVEVPIEETSDLKVTMIFDESLPAEI